MAGLARRTAPRCPRMLTESDVTEAVCRFLKTRGYRVTQQLSESEAGDDIIAYSANGTKVMIEAKGETSSKSHTPRFGKPFSSGQVLDHVSKAFYRAASYVAEHVSAGIALPKNNAHVSVVTRVQPVLARLNIEVFWVQPEGREVEVTGNWKTWANSTVERDAGKRPLSSTRHRGC